MRWLLLVTMLGCSANDDFPAPQVSSVTPDHAPAGSVVQVNGQHFCQSPVGEDPACDTSGTVQFGAVPGVVSTYNDNSVLVEVPTGIAGHVSVTVSAAGKTSNAVSFTVD
jgi:hypothetical protein